MREVGRARGLPEAVVRTKPLEGLGTETGLIQRVCSDDPETPDPIGQTLRSHQGARTDFVDTADEVKPRPDWYAKANALRRLRQESASNPAAADAYRRVLAVP